ncbi:MAG: Snf7 family protein [Candidatus Bathyarchaeota archaeon]|nr:Snf7 family protein [Candidatus Bathyarchaeota archaeon]
MSKFSKDWEGRAEGNIMGRIVSAVKPQQPMKYKISLATKRIEAQVQALEGAINSMNQRDKSLFSHVVDAYSNHDLKRATMYANELAELRKTINLMLNAKLALERVSLRLSTITFVGNVAAAIAPAIEILKDVRSGIASVMPSAEREIDAIISLLDEVMIESGQVSGVGFGLEATSEEAQKILDEAALVAEERAREKFPELVASKPAAEAEREKFG